MHLIQFIHMMANDLTSNNFNVSRASKAHKLSRHLQQCTFTKHEKRMLTSKSLSNLKRAKIT